MNLSRGNHQYTVEHVDQILFSTDSLISHIKVNHKVMCGMEIVRCSHVNSKLEVYIRKPFFEYKTRRMLTISSDEDSLETIRRAIYQELDREVQGCLSKMVMTCCFPNHTQECSFHKHQGLRQLADLNVDPTIFLLKRMVWRTPDLGSEDAALIVKLYGEKVIEESLKSARSTKQFESRKTDFFDILESYIEMNKLQSSRGKSSDLQEMDDSLGI